MSSHDEIADALTKIYSLFLDVGYIDEKSIRWPPHPKGVLDTSRLLRMSVSQSSISLLEKTPFAAVDLHFTCTSYFLDWSNEYDLYTVEGLLANPEMILNDVNASESSDESQGSDDKEYAEGPRRRPARSAKPVQPQVIPKQRKERVTQVEVRSFFDSAGKITCGTVLPLALEIPGVDGRTLLLDSEEGTFHC
jgi:hypothetical protein